MENGGCGCVRDFGTAAEALDSSRADQALVEWSQQLSASAERDEQTLLEAVASLPAPKMLHHPPAKLELRLLELIRDALNDHADAEAQAHKHPTYEKIEYAKQCSRKLWAMAPAILAVPAEALNQTQDPAGMQYKFEVAEVVRGRLQMAETGAWEQLYSNLGELQRRMDTDMQQNFLHTQLSDDGGEDILFSRVAGKVHNGGLQAAKNMLLGQTVCRMDAAAAEQMQELIDSEVP